MPKPEATHPCLARRPLSYLQQYMAKGGDIHYQENGRNAWFGVIEFCLDYAERIGFLLQHNVDVNAVDRNSTFKNTVLHACIANETTDLILYLMEAVRKSNQSLDFTIRDSEGKTPLLIACKTANATVAKAILIEMLKQDLSEYINTPDDRGFTPLHFACMFGLAEVVKMLLENEAKTDLKSDTKLTAFDMLAYDDTSISAWLESIEINSSRACNASNNNFVDNHSYQSFYAFNTEKRDIDFNRSSDKMIANLDNIPLIEELFLQPKIIDSRSMLTANSLDTFTFLTEEQKANFITQFKKLSPESLLSACLKRQLDVLEIILPQMSDEQAGLLLRRCATCNRKDLVQAILKTRLSIINQAGNKSGATALFQCAAYGHQTLYNYLVSMGAKPDQENKKGITPAMRLNKKSLYLSVSCVLSNTAKVLVHSRALELRDSFLAKFKLSKPKGDSLIIEADGLPDVPGGSAKIEIIPGKWIYQSPSAKLLLNNGQSMTVDGSTLQP